MTYEGRVGKEVNVRLKAGEGGVPVDRKANQIHYCASFKSVFIYLF